MGQPLIGKEMSLSKKKIQKNPTQTKTPKWLCADSFDKGSGYLFFIPVLQGTAAVYFQLYLFLKLDVCAMTFFQKLLSTLSLNIQ